MPRTTRFATFPSGLSRANQSPTCRLCFFAKRVRTIAPSPPSFPRVAFEPSTHVKWKNRETVCVSRPVSVVCEPPSWTAALRTFETAATPGVRASAAAAAGENESQPEAVVRT